MAYVGICTENGKRIDDEYALEYAMERCGIQAVDGEVDPEFAEMLVEWFYSGNWVYEEDER